MFDKIQIDDFYQGGFCGNNIDGICHKKALPFLSVVQAVEGSYDIILNGGPQFNTGDGGFFIAPANATQVITHNTDKKTGLMNARWVLLKVKVDDSYLMDNILDFPVILPEDKKIELNSVFDEVFDGSATTCDKYIAYYKIVKILLSVATQNESHIDSRLLKSFLYIKNNYSKNISVSDLSKNSNMSEANFYKFFKKHTGYSPIKYLNDYRLSLASSMLLSTDNSIQSISEDVGIPDSVYFYKLFKRNYQMPPSEYRRVYRSR